MCESLNFRIFLKYFKYYLLSKTVLYYIFETGYYWWKLVDFLTSWYLFLDFFPITFTNEKSINMYFEKDATDQNFMNKRPHFFNTSKDRRKTTRVWLTAYAQQEQFCCGNQFHFVNTSYWWKYLFESGHSKKYRAKVTWFYNPWNEVTELANNSYTRWPR